MAKQYSALKTNTGPGNCQLIILPNMGPESTSFSRRREACILIMAACKKLGDRIFFVNAISLSPSIIAD